MNKIDILQGKILVEDSYLFFNENYRYFKVLETNPHKHFVLGINRSV